MQLLPFLSRTWNDRVHRIVTWTVTVTTIAWSIGLNFAITALPARAAHQAGHAPVLSGGGPNDSQTFVPPDAIIDINADGALNPGTVTTANVTLYPCAGATDATSCASPTTTTNLCNSVTAQNSNARIVCSTSAPLTVNTTYRLQVTTGVQAADNTPVATNVTRIFRTSSVSPSMNTTLPHVQSTAPQAGAMSVPTNLPLSFFFPMGPEGDMLADGTANAVNNVANVLVQALVNGATTGADNCVTGSCTLSWNSATRSLSATLTLGASTQYDACLTGNVRNTASQGIGGNYCIRFTTSGGADSAPPAVAATSPFNPANGDTSVSRFLSDVSIRFSESLAPSTMTLTNVSLYIDSDSSSTMNGAEVMLTASGLTVIAEPDNRMFRLGLVQPLAASTRYCYRITTGATDLAGNAMALNQGNCFTTGSATDTASPTVLFGDADSFKLAVSFSEPILRSTATNAANYSLECPTGVPISLTGKTVTYFEDQRSAEIHGLGLPPGQTCKVTVTTSVTDLAGNAMSATANANVASFVIQDAAHTGGFVGFGGMDQNFHTGTNFATFWEKPTRCEPDNRIVSKSTRFRCEFPAPAALASGSTFTLTLPEGFTYSDSNGNTRAIPATLSFDNADLNGPATGAPTIASASCTAASKTCTITTGSASIGNGDMVRFEFDRLTTPANPVTDQRISIVIKDASGVKQGQTLNATPFSIQQGGSLSISGTVYKDSDNDDVVDAGEGLANIKIFCDSFGGFTVGTTGGVMAGHQETTTNANGAWSVSGLSAGQYGCGMPPDPTNLDGLIGGNQFRNVSLSTASASGIDFKFRDLSVGGAGQDLSVTITGSAALANKQVDVFCHAGATDFQFSQPVMKVVTLNASGGGTATVKLLAGKTYECGLGPHIDFSNFSGGGPPPVPEFDFLPPPFQKVNVPSTSAPTPITFALTSASNTITGSVKDGSNNGIANVYVHARPIGCFDETTGAFKSCFGGFAQTKSDGTFTLKVTPGTYEVGADAPGMPPSGDIEVSVALDGTVTSDGVAVGGSGITLKLAKSSVTISGQVLDESGNGIPYAHVSAESVATGGTCSSFSPKGGFRDSPTDQSGNYTVYVSNGTWLVRAFAPSYGEVGCTPVVVSSDTSASGQNIQATATNFNTISGTAPDGTFVNAFSPGTGGNHVVASGGTYSMKVKAGTYTVECFAHGKGPCGRQQNVNASSGSATVNFSTTITTGTVAVTITGITDAYVDLHDSTGKGQGTNQNSSGVYTIQVAPGTYALRGGSPKYGELCGSKSITVTANATTTATCTPPANLRSITGRVTDGTSNVGGATVTLTDSSGKMFNATSGAQSGSTSNLSIANVPDGTYTMKAAKSGHESATTIATVSGGNLDLSSPIAMTPTTGTSGESVTVTVQESGSSYAGDGRVIATKTSGGVTKTVMGSLDQTTGTTSLDLTNGTWTVKAVGTNGKESTSSTVTVSGGSLSGSAPTLSLANSVSGFTAASESPTITPKSGGKISSSVISGFEVNIPASALSTTDSSNGKVELKRDPTVKDVDPGADMNFVGSSGIAVTPKDSNGNELGGTSLNSTCTLTIPYTDADVSAAGVDESKLTVGSLNANGEWETFPTTVDTANNVLTAEVTHFSTFGILGGGSSGSPSATSDATPPAVPSNISSTANGTQATITWTDPSDSDLDSVEVLRNNPPSTAVSGTPLSRVVKGVQKYIDTFLSPSTVYTYILRSRDRSGNTRNSNAMSVTTSAATTTTTTPATPTTGTGTTVPATPAAAAPAVAAPAAAAPAAPAALPGLATIGLSVGDLVRSPSSSTIYLVGADGKRYVFPNETTFKSWHADFSAVKKITDAQMSQLSLGGVVTMRPGTWLVKIESDPKVYAVEPGGVLRWVETEARARLLYGSSWNRQIADVPVSYWVAYRSGNPLGADIHPSGTVVRSGAATLYIDQSAQRDVSPAVFRAHGFQERFVRALASSIVYTSGPALVADANLKFAQE